MKSEHSIGLLFNAPENKCLAPTTWTGLTRSQLTKLAPSPSCHILLPTFGCFTVLIMAKPATKGASRTSSRGSSKGSWKVSNTENGGEKLNSSISRELYTIKSAESIGSSSTAGSGLRNASDGEGPVCNTSLPSRNRLLSSLLEGHEFGSSTEESTEYGSESWSGSQSTTSGHSSDEAFMMISTKNRGHGSFTEYSVVSEVTNETGLTTAVTTEATSIFGGSSSDADLSTLLEDEEEGVYESGSYDSDESGESETFITGESETYHSDGDASGDDSYTHSNEETGSFVSETYDSDESQTYQSTQKSPSRDDSFMSAVNMSQSRELSACTSEESQSSYSGCETSKNSAPDLTGQENTFHHEDMDMPSPRMKDGQSRSDSRAIHKVGSNADSTGTKPALPSRNPPTPPDEVMARQQSAPYFHFEALTLENVQYVTSFDVASTEGDLSTVDQPITKAMAADVFSKRIIPVSIPAESQEDVSTLCGGTRNGSESEREGDSSKHMSRIDVELGLHIPTLKFPSTGDEATISTYGSIYGRSRLELYFMGMIALSGVTLVILVAILLSGR